MLSAAPLVSSEPSTDTLALGTSLGESFIEEPLRKDSDGDSMLTLYVPEVKDCKYNRGWRAVYSSF